MIRYRNLKTHIPAIPVNPCLSLSLHRIQRMQDNLKIQVDIEPLQELKLLFKKVRKTSETLGWEPKPCFKLLQARAI